MQGFHRFYLAEATTQSLSALHLAARGGRGKSRDSSCGCKDMHDHV